MAPNDSTVVTGPSTGARLPRTGDVMAERWEIRASISSDGLYATYRGVDQETEQSVLVRVIAMGRLAERDAQRIAARMRLLIGMGGPTLSPIRDADHEGARLFVIEKFPDGASFRSVLDTRRAKNQLFAPAELVPLVAHLSNALSAITPPWFHGDVRAERIYVGPDRVLLTGGFVLPLMSTDVISETLEADALLRQELAPEVGEGHAGPAADRFGVAALAWEALTGQRFVLPASGVVAPPEALGELGATLVRYLHRDPAARPATLDPLLQALLARARVPMPRIPPESFSVSEPPTDIDTTELAHRPDDALAETVELHASATAQSGPARTVEVLPDEPLPSHAHSSDSLPSDTAKHQALDGKGRPISKPPASKSDRPDKRDLTGIDPALLQAASAGRALTDSGTYKLDTKELRSLDAEAAARALGGMSKKKPTGEGDLDPRLVRAALGVSLDSANDTLPTTSSVKPAKAGSLPAPKRPMPKAKQPGVTQEIEASDLEILGGTKPFSPGKPAPAAPRPQSLDSAMTFVGAGRASAPAPAPAPRAAPAPVPAPVPAAPRRAAPAPVAVAAAPAPVAAPPASAAPRPTPMAAALSLPPFPGAGSPGRDPFGGVPAPANQDETPAYPQALAPRTPSNPPPAAVAPPRAAGNLPAQEAPTTAQAPQVSGLLIIAIAMLVAAVILGAAFWYRSAQEDAAREHRIEERLRELRHRP